MEFTRESLSNLPFVNKKRDGFIHPAHAINHRFSIDTETYPLIKISLEIPQEEYRSSCKSSCNLRRKSGGNERPGIIRKRFEKTSFTRSNYFPDYNPLLPPSSNPPSSSSIPKFLERGSCNFRKNFISLDGRRGGRAVGWREGCDRIVCTVNSRFTVHTSLPVACDNKRIAAIKINRYLGNRSVNLYEANISGNDMLFKAAIIFQLVNKFSGWERRAGGYQPP